MMLWFGQPKSSIHLKCVSYYISNNNDLFLKKKKKKKKKKKTPNVYTNNILYLQCEAPSYVKKLKVKLSLDKNEREGFS
jgi:hypothetical protein